MSHKSVTPRRWHSMIASCFCELCCGALYAVGLYMPYLQARFHLTLSQVQVGSRARSNCAYMAVGL